MGVSGAEVLRNRGAEGGRREIDLQAHRVAAINRGASHIPDVPSATLAPLVQAGQLSATTDYATCAAADALVICVPTPFTKMIAAYRAERGEAWSRK